MRIGIPKGLLYYKYEIFMKTFFEELGCEVIVSPNTNKEILNLGVKYAVDEACVPIKVFHGHVAYIKDSCDFMVIPRVMRLYPREYICPKFCGLPEMIKNSIPDMPPITDGEIYAYDEKKFFKYLCNVGKNITRNKRKIYRAYEKALLDQKEHRIFINNTKHNMKIALLGHPYNVQDSFMNMNIVKKLNKLGVGVITEENLHDEDINKYSRELLKRPFWTFARKSYGAAVKLWESKEINGIIYLSSFACGIDSVVIELIKDKIGEFPFLILKIDEQTGEGGFNTRVEAFVDMIERRKKYEDNISPSRECLHCS
ncbi:acyl-CoA dehydratase activase-related protein [Clostridium sp. KNHs214]|uniref:acyl-CoA dehydratase activase-related protein n=1 Tax=Clostridium sp. KNHs214 TaxID=1540257 RepID=UPI00054F06A8|nr:acyl-CoA dehydratase activase-related protein [Clostridium sp. KNHs214]